MGEAEEERGCEYIAPVIKAEETCFDSIKNHRMKKVLIAVVCASLVK